MHSHIMQTVADLLLQQPRLQLPINPFSLRHKKQVVVQSVDDFFLRTPAKKTDYHEYIALQDGLTITTKRGDEPLYLVLYNSEVKNKARRFFTIAHELGHVYLDHGEDDAEQEKEADVFAAELLAPRCLLWELHQRYDGTVPTDVVQETFGVSASMAKRRLDHVYGKPLPNTPERELWERAKALLPRPGEPTVSVTM